MITKKIVEGVILHDNHDGMGDRTLREGLDAESEKNREATHKHFHYQAFTSNVPTDSFPVVVV